MKLYWKVLCLACIISVGNVLAADPPKPWISLRANTIDLRCLNPVEIQEILLDVVGVKLIDVKLASERPAYIKLGKTFAKEYIDAVKGEPFLDKGKGRLVLKLTIDLQKLDAVGAYEGAFVLTAKGKDPVEVILTMNRPAVKLESQGKILIDVVGGEVMRRDMICMRETTRVSSAFDVELKNPYFQGAKENELLTLDVKKLSFKAGEQTKIAYTPDVPKIESLPYGKYAGKMEILTAAMSAPAVIEFEVTNKAGKLLLISLLAGGILFGLFVRKYLVSRKKSDEKKYVALSTLLNITKDLEKITDPEFKASVTDVVEELRLAMGKSSIPPFGVTPEELDALAQKVVAAYKAKFDAFVLIREAAAKGVADNSKMFEKTDWTVPAQHFVKALKPAFDAASLAVEQGHFTKATLHLSTVTEEVKKQWTWYQPMADEFLKYFEVSGGSVSIAIAGTAPDAQLPEVQTLEKVTSAIKAEAATTRANLDTVKDAPTLATLQSATATVNDSYASLIWMTEYINSTVSELLKPDVGDNTTIQEKAATKAFNSWSQELQKATQLSARIPALTQVLLNSANQLSSDWLKVRSVPKQTILNDPTPKTKAVAPAAPEKDAKTEFGKSNGVLPPLTREEINAEIKNVKWSWWLAAGLQGIILLGLMVAAGLNFYSTNFIGTPAECISIFLFAFGVDISVEGLVALRDKK